ncbi:MAG: hypothetical protein ACFFBS_01165 [Promethearchaeota archaeon]
MVKWTPKRLLIYFAVIWITGIFVEVFVLPILWPERDPLWIISSLVTVSLALGLIYYVKVYTAPKDYLKVRRTPEDYRKLLGNTRVYVMLLFFIFGFGGGLGFFGITAPIVLLHWTLTGNPLPPSWGFLTFIGGPLIGLCVMAFIVKKKYPWFIDRMWLIELYAQEEGEEEGEQELTESIDQ